MNLLRKVLVVDDGERRLPDLLSTELAELGFSSVTTSREAANDVLAVIEEPSAIFIRLPQQAGNQSQNQSFLTFADELRRTRPAGIPVIVWDRQMSLAPGGVAAVLQREFGPAALTSLEA
jgi:hypothetical protein